MTSQPVCCFDRWEHCFSADSGIAAVRFVPPNGTASTRPTFRHQPVTLQYDDHGYESVLATGPEVLAVRFTPTVAGQWTWHAVRNAQTIATGGFECEPSAAAGFVEVSPDDPRYFRCSDGTPYVPIGLNLCWAPSYALATGNEFEQAAQFGTLGTREYARWFSRLAANGGNYARLWLSHSFFAVEGDTAGELNMQAFGRLDAVVAAASGQGIRLKLCFEYFRRVQAGPGPEAFCRVLRDPQSGATVAAMDDWFQNPRWQELWWQKVDAYLARYGDDPVVMAWELWNEIDCCATSHWYVQRDWTNLTLARLKRRCPHNLVTNSLGSFDYDNKQVFQDDFKMDALDFQQVHRYLDQGAGLESCRSDAVAASIEAVQLSRRPDRPIILTETGAVNDCHTGPFRYYRWDGDGLIFHDTTYPAFFAGAAGSGHIWHWDQYVDHKNLWAGFGALAAVVKGVALDREAMQAIDLSTDRYWCLVLRGRTWTLGWLRNRADRWDHVYRDGQVPPPVIATVDLRKLNVTVDRVETFQPWPDDGGGAVAVGDGVARFPAFRHGLVFRLHQVSAKPSHAKA